MPKTLKLTDNELRILSADHRVTAETIQKPKTKEQAQKLAKLWARIERLEGGITKNTTAGEAEESQQPIHDEEQTAD